MRKFLIIAIVILAVASSVFIWQTAKSRRAVKNGIEVTKVIKADFIKTVASSGKTKADSSVSLKFQTSGKLAWVGVKEGDAVRAHQAIAGLDLREVQKALEQELKDYAKQRNDFEETRFVTYPWKNAANAPNDTAKRILEKNQWDLEKAVLDVELKQLAVEYATLVTPIAGIVTHIDTPVAGVNITPATAAFDIADPKSLVFEANIDEIDVGSLSVGQRATVTLDAFPQTTFSGTVSYVSFTSHISPGGATVFPVKIAFDQPQKLRIGLNGDVTIEAEKREQVLLVPIEAIREDDDGKYVYKKTGGEYTKQPVAIASQNDSDAVIASGLAEGDDVVIRGFTNIPKIK